MKLNIDSTFKSSITRDEWKDFCSKMDIRYLPNHFGGNVFAKDNITINFGNPVATDIAIVANPTKKREIVFTADAPKHFVNKMIISGQWTNRNEIFSLLTLIFDKWEGVYDTEHENLNEYLRARFYPESFHKH